MFAWACGMQERRRDPDKPGPGDLSSANRAGDTINRRNPPVRGHGRRGGVAELDWTIRLADGITAASILEPAGPHETGSAQAIHMVERADFWHAIVDMAVRRTGRRRRAGQPVLPHARRQDRSIAWLRATLGDLQRLCRGVAGTALMAWLAASYRRSPADRRGLRAA